jgi:hypothetical protein
MGMDVSEGDDSVDVVLKFVNKYIELEPMGPFINGDLVIQGCSYQITHVPAVCKIEFAAEHEEDFREVYTIMPWEMIYQAAEGETPDSVAIPIQLPPECREGMVHVKVYVDEPSRVPHDNPDDKFDANASTLILALDFTTPCSAASAGMEDTGRAASYSIIQSIKAVHASSDESSMNELASAGYESCTVYDMSRGFGEMSGTGPWKFVLGSAKSEETEVGIEDVIFVSKNEETGEMEVPDGYEVDGLNLLSLQDSPHEVRDSMLYLQ